MPVNVNLARGGVAAALAATDAATTTLVLTERLAPEEMALVAAYIARGKRVWLVAASDEGFPHLEFLSAAPNVPWVDVRCRILSDLAGISHVAEALRRLRLGSTQWPATPLTALRSASRLDHLSLDGWTKDLEFVGDLVGLRHLSLAGARRKDAEFLDGATSLGVLEWSLGRTSDLSAVGRLNRLEFLALRRGSAVTQFESVAEIVSLRHLVLSSLTSLRSLPDFSGLAGLEVVHLSDCKVLKDLTPLLTAPGLRFVSISRMGHLTSDDIGFLSDHPNAPMVRVRLGTLEHTREAVEVLGVQAVVEGHPAEVPDLPRFPNGCWAFSNHLAAVCPEASVG